MLKKSFNYVLLALLLLWTIGGYALLKGEAGALRLMPALISMGAQGRGIAVVGDIYMLSEKAASLIPEDSTIHLVLPPSIPDTASLVWRLRYYQYPRKVKEVFGRDGPARPEGGDYVLILIPASYAREGVADIYGFLKGLGRMEKVHEHSGPKGYQAIYRVI